MSAVNDKQKKKVVTFLLGNVFRYICCGFHLLSLSLRTVCCFVSIGTATPGDGLGVPHVAYREATTDATLSLSEYQVPHDLSTNYGSHHLQQVDTPAATTTLQTFVPLGLLI